MCDMNMCNRSIQTLRCWLKNDEEIDTDMATCAMAFCLLRMNGFDISSGTFCLKLEGFELWLLWCKMYISILGADLMC